MLTERQVKFLNAIIQEINITVKVQPDKVFYDMFKTTHVEAKECVKLIEKVISNDMFELGGLIIGWRGNLMNWHDLRDLFKELKATNLIHLYDGEKI